ncbi:hypothetical protein ILYODFUR_032861 [Ilyodon furcidens]|uniref:Uncharacterized protein n=1 Tax=Ilyodon furcidens TaxID=33524 RepID=A0ABV0TCZ8_9TELE
MTQRVVSSDLKSSLVCAATAPCCSSSPPVIQYRIDCNPGVALDLLCCAPVTNFSVLLIYICTTPVCSKKHTQITQLLGLSILGDRPAGLRSSTCAAQQTSQP